MSDALIRVLVVDDHPIFRRGLAALLEGAGDIAVVAEADDGIRALRVAAEVTWDVALLDVSMPRLNGIEVLRRLRDAYPERRVLVLSQFPEDQFRVRVIRDGAAGYIAKSAPPEELLDAIRRVASGRPLAEPPTPVLAPNPSADALPHERLTPREYQVFTLIACGRTVTDIAAELNVATSTVSNHLWNIKDKLGVTTTGAIVSYAHRVGLVE
jgi:DNA-binding NarL/FixJ family response regulator